MHKIRLIHIGTPDTFVQIYAPQNNPKNVTSHTLSLILEWFFSEQKQYLRLPFKINKHAHF